MSNGIGHVTKGDVRKCLAEDHRDQMNLSDSEFEVLERQKLHWGHNYLVSDGTVYSIFAWADGSKYERQMWRPGDPGYISHYLHAVKNRYSETLFRERSIAGVTALRETK